MEWVANIDKPFAQRFVIKRDVAVGYYLYVYERGQCIRDHLQDTLDLAIGCALEDYGVPTDRWQKID
jgi:hypothetical protein